MPEDGYHGDYTQALADELPEPVLAAAQAPGADPAEVVGAGQPARFARGSRRASPTSASTSTSGRARARSTPRAGSSGRSSGCGPAAIVYEQDGATWFRSTAFGDDKDRVILRSNGEPTYFASDIGYVTEKFSRGFEELIYIWGADHHGTVARVRNAAEAMGYDKDAVRMLLIAWVRFIVDGVEVSMSKRAGTFITLDQLLDEVGRRRGPLVLRLTRPDIGDRLRHRAGQEAVEREPRLLRPVRPCPDRLDPAPGRRGRPRAGILGRRRDRPDRPRRSLPGRSSGCPRWSRTPRPSRSRRGSPPIATELATAFHAFYRDAKVVDPAEPERSRARLALVSAAKITLANALALLGISAPESM